MEYYSNFKKYTHKNQRLAIFGKEIDGELEVFKLICNPKDRFIKNIAKSVYVNWSKKDSSKEWEDYLLQFHPIITRIVIEKGDSAEYTFKKYCNLYYTKKIHTIETIPNITYEYLDCENNDYIILKNTLKWN